MSDVKCPYCGQEQEINHDDGYGYEEDKRHEQECMDCEREFEFTTAIIFSYSVYCSEEDHNLIGSEFEKSLYQCTKCDHYEVIENDNN